MADDDSKVYDFGRDSGGDEDHFAPPAEPCECYCLHCNRTFMSDGIWFQRIIGDKTLKGFWCCPTPNCSGAGFTFDIFPTDPLHPANANWTYDDDEEVYLEEAYGEDGTSESEFSDFPDIQTAADAKEWDPDEPMYKAMDQMDEEIEGEEWKFGLQPGQHPLDERPLPAPDSPQWSEDDRRFDLPDERPRELDWTNREDRGETLREDDIPF